MRSCSAKMHFVPGELSELRRRVELLSGDDRDELLPLCRSLSRWSQQQQRLVAAAQEAVHQLQLDVRYMTFDLEATRRERDAFRARLERA